MKKRKGFLKAKKWAIVVITILVLSQYLSGCFSFRMSKSEVEKYFAESDIKPKLSKYTLDHRTINYLDTEVDSLPMVIFLHGAPGSLSAFIHFFKDTSLQQASRIVSVDRPGYGYSNFGWSEKSLKEQSKLLSPILELNTHEQKPILVGHSLGGPVAARMAMDYPDLVGGIILVAPSVDPELEPEEWYRPILYSPFARWILPKSFRVTNDEIYFLKKELEAMLPLWETLKMPIIVIQGGADKLVHPKNAEFVQNLATNTTVEIVFVDGMNHFVPWNNEKLITDAVMKQLNSDHFINNLIVLDSVPTLKGTK